MVIQSSFRYDYPIEKVKTAIKQIIKELPGKNTNMLEPKYLEKIRKIIPMFEKPYREIVEKIAPLIDQTSLSIPQRRERVQHIGLFGYSRMVGKVRLPRAIGFTGSCYSLGIPPELFGTGQGIALVRKKGELKTVESLYRNLKSTLQRAGRYLRKKSIKELGLTQIENEIKEIEKYLGEKLGPKTDAEKEHAEIVEKIIKRIQNKQKSRTLIEKAANLRRSLG